VAETMDSKRVGPISRRCSIGSRSERTAPVYPHGPTTRDSRIRRWPGAANGPSARPA